jgi:hypothetical protein
VGAAVGSAVLRRLVEGNLVERSKVKGELLISRFHETFAESPHVGDIRGLGLMVGIEIVRDRARGEPFPRADKVTERIVAAAKERGLLVYSGTGSANGTDGDLIMFGPPFIITDDEIEQLVGITTEALASVL